MIWHVLYHARNASLFMISHSCLWKTVRTLFLFFLTSFSSRNLNILFYLQISIFWKLYL
jgi:hypothetical protein